MLWSFIFQTILFPVLFVRPASGVLQHLVREIFKDFEDWTVIIFENFLILADDHADALEKFKKILQRCDEKGFVLKMKKSFTVTDNVTFFGYKVTHGAWELDERRKEAIDNISFLKNTKDMQSVLGCAVLPSSYSRLFRVECKVV